MGRKILIVDDHEVMREGVRSLIAKSRQEWTICGEAASAEEAIHLAQTQKPDVIVMDLTMPGMSGLEATARIRGLQLQIPILIFTMHESERLESDVRGADAQGYVLKSQAARDLMLGLECLLQGGTFFGPSSDIEKSERRNPHKGRPFFRLAFVQS